MSRSETSSKRTRRAAKGGAIALGATTLLAFSATQAFSANSFVSLDVGSPTAEIATTIKVRTIADQSSVRFAVKTRAPGGPACAPTFESDPGDELAGFDYGSQEEVAVGDSVTERVHTFESAGPVEWCGWLRQRLLFGVGPVLATSKGAFTVASPTGAITGVQAPNPAPVGQTFTVTIQGNSLVERSLYTSLRPESEPACAATPPEDPRTSDSPRRQATVLGNFSVALTFNKSEAGAYRLCSWVAESSSDIRPLGVNETRIQVGAPPPPAPTCGPATPLPSRGPAKSSAKFSLTSDQLLINQRIGQAAIRRLAAAEARLEGRSAPKITPTGGKVTLSAAQLLINQRIYQFGVIRAAALEARCRGESAPSAPKRTGGKVELTISQLQINQRIAQFAVLRANALSRRIS